MLVTSNDSQDKLCGERVWKNNGFFQDLRPDLNLEKKSVPENTIFYVNQSLLSTVKNGNIAMYNHNFILGQLVVAASQPSDINAYECKENEVNLCCCIDDLTTGEFQGVREQLAYIVLRGDKEEVFFSHGFCSAKSKVLYSCSKNKIPHAFVSTAFKKHYFEIRNEKRDNQDSSSLFFFLPSITDRKESINQWMGNVNLVPVDLTVEFNEDFPSKKKKFKPHLLNSADPEERAPQVKTLLGVFKHMAQYSNQKLSRNVDYLFVKENKKGESMEWSIGLSKHRYDSSKFKLTY